MFQREVGQEREDLQCRQGTGAGEGAAGTGEGGREGQEAVKGVGVEGEEALEDRDEAWARQLIQDVPAVPKEP